MTPIPTSKPYVQSGDPVKDFLPSFWRRQIDEAEQETPDYRHPPLPLARIKKVMKSDPDVKMIAADAPIIFCKACEIFIAEITARAFIVADANKRRTLSRADIAKALAKSDQFDFLIDFMPREELAPSPTTPGTSGVNRDDPLLRSNPVDMSSFASQRPPLPHSNANPTHLGMGESEHMVSGEQNTQVLEQLDALLNAQQGGGRSLG